MWSGGRGESFAGRSSDAELAAEDVVVVVDLDALVGVEVEFDLRRRLERHRRESDLGGDAALEIARSTMAAIEDIPADLQGSSAYRARVGATMLARALSEALAAASEKE